MHHRHRRCITEQASTDDNSPIRRLFQLSQALPNGQTNVGARQTIDQATGQLLSKLLRHTGGLTRALWRPFHHDLIRQGKPYLWLALDEGIC